jgi:CheY-like chemotaxis protein
MARLTAELLHDLTDVLATHGALIELARLEAREGGASPASLNRVQASGEQIRRMVSDLFDEVRGARESPEVEFDPGLEAQTAFEHWRTQSPPVRIDFACEVPAEVRVRGRSSFFTRALVNLLRNAGRHARSRVRARLTVEVDAGERWLQLVVEDDGSGVPEALRRQIFDPYVHGGSGGTGLGLAMTRWGVERLGGSVELGAGSALGGACFVVRVPAVVRRGGRTGLPPEERLDGMRIALVDDNLPLARVFHRLAGREGATLVHVAPPPHPAAADLAREVVGACPDVVVLDAALGTLRGADVWRSLQEIAPELAERVLFLSGGLPPPGPEGDAMAERWVAKSDGWEGLRSRILELRRDRS